MKKIISLLLALTLMASLFAACGKDEPVPNEPENEIVDTPTDDGTQTPVDDDAPVADETEEVDEPKDSEAKPEEKPSETPAAKPETKPNTKPNATQDAKPETKPNTKPNTTPDAKPETKPNATQTAKPATKPSATPTAKPESKPTTAPEKESNTTETIKPEEKPNTTPTVKPETKPESKPETKPESETTLPQVPAEKEYSVKDVHNIIKNTYGEDYYPNVEVPKEALTDLYGLNANDIEEYVAEQPMISANIDTFIAIKAKAGKGADVAATLSNYKENLVNGMMYPSNMPKAQAAQVVRHGDYVFLIMLGASGDLEADDETRNKFAKEQVSKGVSAINSYFSK